MSDPLGIQGLERLPDCEIGPYEKVWIDRNQGHLMVLHDGSITWDALQELKNIVWGASARAIEVYPATGSLVNAANIRHLWLLGPHDFAPDLLGYDGAEDSLQSRCAVAWNGAR